jgi:hypothetical protein
VIAGLGGGGRLDSNKTTAKKVRASFNLSMYGANCTGFLCGKSGNSALSDVRYVHRNRNSMWNDVIFCSFLLVNIMLP